MTALTLFATTFQTVFPQKSRRGKNNTNITAICSWTSKENSILFDKLYHLSYIQFMGYKVKLFSKDGKEPVLDAILSTEPKMQAKIYREISLLEEFGT